VNIVYVCTNYNNSALTVAAVASLLKNCGDHDIRVIIVDNASRPEEVEIVRRLSAGHPIVHVIANASNVGYFGGLNLGIDASRKLYPDIGWIVAGNNDLEFPEDFCDRVQHAQPDFQAHSVISPDIVTLDGEHQNPHVVSGISSLREILYDLYYSNYYLGQAVYKLAKMFPKATRRGDEDQWQTARLIYQGHGACYLLTPKFFDKYGKLWAPTFMMAEEAFLSLQLKKGGEQVYYSPAIRVTHRWHGSLQSVPSRHRWTMARDAHLEYRKHVKVFQSAGR
jgi:GT2 family glycosyltransferase